MADCPTFEELFRIARDEALSRNSRLKLEVLDRKGSDANAMLAAATAVSDAVMGRVIAYNANLFLESAKGPALDKLVWDRYRLLRKKASPALGEVEVSSASAAPAAFDITAGTVFRTTDRKVFFATETVNFPSGSSGPVTVPVQSVLSGANQQAAVGTITSIDLAGAPVALTVTNAAATAGAADEEKDEALRDRARRFYTTSQRGTLAAIERRALDVDGVTTARAFEAVEADATPARLVELVVTDTLTEELADATVLPGGYQAQATQLALVVKSALSDTRAAGIQVVVTIGQVRLLGVTLLLRFRTGVTVAAVAAAARAVAVAYTNSLAPGDSFVPVDLEALLASVPGLVVLGGEVTPSVEQTCEQLQVWRTLPSLVTVGNIS